MSTNPTVQYGRSVDERRRCAFYVPRTEGFDIFSSVVEWRYDASTSRVLRLVAHGVIVGLGGPIRLVTTTLALLLPTAFRGFDPGPLFLAAPFVLVGALSCVLGWCGR